MYIFFLLNKGVRPTSLYLILIPSPSLLLLEWPGSTPLSNKWLAEASHSRAPL